MAETCYGHTGPDAVSLPDYGPCNPQAGSTSLCCEIGQTCLTNGLCVTPDEVYYNGGCTDSTYKAAICPTFCTSGRHCNHIFSFRQANVCIRRRQLGGGMPRRCCSRRRLLLLYRWFNDLLQYRQQWLRSRGRHLVGSSSICNVCWDQHCSGTHQQWCYHFKLWNKWE